ncbi:MAG: hypothetical protein MJZ53_06800 [Paludibacteraceae bacterium]|nr:hypothetical protein [Paludibacteraceae bacterium]
MSINIGDKVAQKTDVLVVVAKCPPDAATNINSIVCKDAKGNEITIYEKDVVKLQ